jgi:hypothetical protein
MIIPGLGHVGLSVSNMQRSLAFYRDLLGMKVTLELDISDDRQARVIGIPGTKCRITHLRLGDGVLELFEYYAAVTNFTQWLAVHISQEYTKNIRVNAVVPGFFLTTQNKFLLTDEKSGKMTPRGQSIVDHTPMARLGAPEDLVGPVMALLSDSFGFVHGTTLIVDGGMSAYGGV